MHKRTQFSRRERQIMDILYELNEATAQQVLDKLPDPPSYSAVRAMLARLEDKQAIAHREQGARYHYYPLIKRETATRNALSRLVTTFFDGSAAQAANALLGMSMHKLSNNELDELESLIQKARDADKGGQSGDEDA